MGLLDSLLGRPKGDLKSFPQTTPPSPPTPPKGPGSGEDGGDGGDIRQKVFAGPVARAEYAARVQAALAQIDRSEYPAGMVQWLETVSPRHYAELTERLPDEMHRLWSAHAPLAQFEVVLARLVEIHQEACAIYDAHLRAQGNGRGGPNKEVKENGQ